MVLPDCAHIGAVQAQFMSRSHQFIEYTLFRNIELYCFTAGTYRSHAEKRGSYGQIDLLERMTTACEEAPDILPVATAVQGEVVYAVEILECGK